MESPICVTAWQELLVAAIPLLWVIPLALYLLSFILVFAKWPPILHRIVVAVLPLVLLVLVFRMLYTVTKWRIIATPINHAEYTGIRVTPNVYTTIEEIDTFGDAMEKISSAS